MSNCKNCDSVITGNFCANCGQAAKPERIDKHYIAHELFHLFHFEKGFFYTVKELMLRPGDSIKEFINSDRSKHMKPVTFLILTSLLYTLIAHLLKADEINNGAAKLGFGSSGTTNILRLQGVQEHYGYANIIISGFIAVSVQLIFKKYKYTFFETIVLICFIQGQVMLLMTLVSFFYKLLDYRGYSVLFSLVTLGYVTWAIGQFFDKKKTASYVKAFLAYCLGFVLFYIAIMLVGMGYDVW